MRYEDLITKVRTRADLPTDADAETVLTATLAVLGERLDPPAAVSVADQLPEQLANYLRQQARAEDERRAFDADEFVDRVATMTDSERTSTERRVAAALAVLGEATGGALDDIRDRLPEDYQRLLADVPGAPGRL